MSEDMLQRPLQLDAPAGWTIVDIAPPSSGGLTTTIMLDQEGQLVGDAASFFMTFAFAVWEVGATRMEHALHEVGGITEAEVAEYRALIDADVSTRIQALPSTAFVPLADLARNLRDAVETIASGGTDGRADAADGVIRGAMAMQRLLLPLAQQSIAAIDLPPAAVDQAGRLQDILPELLLSGGFSLVRNADDGSYTITAGGVPAAVSADDITILIGTGGQSGTDNDDIIIGNLSVAEINAGAGDDTVTGRFIPDEILDGGAGVDTVSYAGAAGAVGARLSGTGWLGDATGDRLTNFERLIGSDYDDILSGSALNDVLRGGGGDDLLDGGRGYDTLDGGDGFDTAAFGSWIQGVSASLKTGFVSDPFGAPVATLISIEALQGSNFAPDQLSGSDGDDVLRGRGGNDRLWGGLGADVLDGGTDLDGSRGADLADYNGAADGIHVDLAIGRGLAGAEAIGDTLISIEQVAGSLVGGDILEGDDANNVLLGFGGDDVLRGRAGADTLDGGRGFDIATYYTAQSGVHVDLMAGQGVAGEEARGDILTSIEGINGSNFAGDSLSGSDGADVLRGFGGNDILRGRGGADILDGGAGFDIVSYFAAAQGVHVDLSTESGLAGAEAGDDVLLSIEGVNGSNAGDDMLYGSAAAEVLKGFGGKDVLRGRGGNDVLVGQSGSDRLEGGDGADRFVYEQLSDSGAGERPATSSLISRAVPAIASTLQRSMSTPIARAIKRSPSLERPGSAARLAA